MRIARLLLVSAGLLAVPWIRASAGSLPLEDKSRFEKVLEAKIETVLGQMLGPGQSRAMVDATIDFSQVEKVEIKGTGASTATANSAQAFLWKSMEQETGPEILPGYPAASSGPDFSKMPLARGGRKYERQLSYPAKFLKKLNVTVLLNDSLTVSKQDEVRKIIGDMLDITPARGDSLNIVTTHFPPAWKTVWYDEKSASLLVKQASIALMVIISLLVMGYTSLKLAGAMSQMAKAQMHQVKFEAPQMGGAGPGLGDEPGLEGALEGAKKKEEGDEDSEEDAGEFLFDVSLEQVPNLNRILSGENPANIALVVGHLASDVRRAFLSALPKEVAAKVMVEMAKTRFVEPESLLNLKEELERQIKGTVGGIEHVLGLLEKSDLQTKTTILEQLRAEDPALAREVRRRTLLLEDLLLLSDREWEFLPIELDQNDWAAILREGDEAEALARKLKAATSEKYWAILTEIRKSALARTKPAAEAREKLVAKVWKLIGTGRIKNPIRDLPERLPESVPDRIPETPSEPSFEPPPGPPQAPPLGPPSDVEDGPPQPPAI